MADFIHWAINSPLGITGCILIVIAVLLSPRAMKGMATVIVLALLAMWALYALREAADRVEQRIEHAITDPIDRAKQYLKDKWRDLLPDCGFACKLIGAADEGSIEAKKQYSDCLEDKVCRLHLTDRVQALGCSQRTTVDDWNACLSGAVRENNPDATQNCVMREGVAAPMVETFEHLGCSFLPSVPEWMKPYVSKGVQDWFACPDLTQAQYVRCLTGPRPN